MRSTVENIEFLINYTVKDANPGRTENSSPLQTARKYRILLSSCSDIIFSFRVLIFIFFVFKYSSSHSEYTAIQNTPFCLTELAAYIYCNTSLMYMKDHSELHLFLGFLSSGS